MSVYLDYNSTAPIDSRVLDFMINIYKNVIGNPDSRTHNYGDEARKTVENARSEVAEILKINKDEVFFTSGATESNNIVFQGLKDYARKSGKNQIITTSIEHKSILETSKHLENEGFVINYIKPNADGLISLEEIKNLITEKTLLVAVMHVNNETGVIQPVKEIGDFLKSKDILFHIDATQSFGKLVNELQNIKYNTMSMSAHKIGGPQGIGALILRKNNYRLPPIKGIMYGGQQEHGIRPGTVPVALVAALGYACKLASQEYIQNNTKCLEIKNAILSELKCSGLNYTINGDINSTIYSTINICIKGVSSEALMLSTKNYCSISNGSACNSKSYKPSYVLLSMGLNESDIENSIRISWGPTSNLEEILPSFRNMLIVAKQLAL